MSLTTAKIGALAGSGFDPKLLLARLKIYRFFLLGSITTTRESNTLARIENAILDLSTDCADGSLRKQPFCVVLYGSPGVGKSSYAIQIARKLMCARYGTFNSWDMVTLNETDEFQSEFRTSHKVVLFDDIGAAPKDCNDTKNPWRKVIDFVNNIRKTALNPNCEMKGKVYIQPDLVILTTNIKIPDSSGAVSNYISCSEAIYRRFSSIIEVLDYDQSKMRKVGVTSSDVHPGTCGKLLAPTNDPDPISRLKSLELLETEFADHMKSQEDFVRELNNNFDDLHISEPLVFEPQSGLCESDPHLNIRLQRVVYDRDRYLSEILNSDIYLRYRLLWTPGTLFTIYHNCIYTQFFGTRRAYSLDAITDVDVQVGFFGYSYLRSEIDAEMLRRFRSSDAS